MADALRLYGLKAIVLAGASGIGTAIARTLAKHGAAVLALDSATSDIEDIYKSVRDVTGKSIDLQKDGVGDTVAQAAIEEFGGIDIVFNYLELPQSSPLEDADQAGLQKLLDARSAHFESVTRATLPELRKSSAGRIISVGFVRSVFGIKGETAYEASHSSLAEFTRMLAVQNGRFGISANYIQPGAIMTPESRKVYAAATDLRDYCIRRSAAGRIGETVDIAKVALFLATDDAVFVSGTGIVVDGGRVDVGN